MSDGTTPDEKESKKGKGQNVRDVMLSTSSYQLRSAREEGGSNIYGLVKAI